MTTWHRRFRPVDHRFSYRFWMVGIDLNELSELDRCIRFFGYNRWAPISIHDRDYIAAGSSSIQCKLDGFLKESGYALGFDSVVFLTVPRVFGYVFNPVSFYLCYTDTRRLAAVVCEVHNTFGEAQLYLVENSLDGEEFKADFPKSFYVSPFFARSGRYQLTVDYRGDDIRLNVDLFDQEELLFSAGISGSGQEIKPLTLARNLLTNPIVAWLTMLRIHIQAFKLYFSRRLPVYEKPVHANLCPVTGRTAGVWQGLRRRVLARARTVK